ncbi:MAG: galactose-1-phosphate uridylyltransferase [Candidatus Aenigmarchaeota archaeon]|nr:galactose-1-phosphate uridylyltransferase [Candidatus Aenigmarchaeota archaeon]
MGEIRKDYILERYVIFSPKRAKRPRGLERKDNYIETPKEKCPFCPGNEHLTPKSILEIPKGKKWKIRSIPNKFPALKETKFYGEEGKFPFVHYRPHGYHEVLIETPEHDKRLYELSKTQIELYLKALIMRYEDLMKKKEITYVTIFKNEGKGSGASISHAHSQIIASPIFPKVIDEEMKASEKYYEEEKRCPFCDVIKYEKKKRVRIISENKEFVVLSPYAAVLPYESWIIPKRHISQISDLNGNQIRYLSSILKQLLKKYEEVFGYLSYTIVYHSFPESDFWHFHIEIYPRLKIYGGFEYFGLYINEILPEQAAKKLKF